MDEHKTMRWWRLLASLAVLNLGLYAWNVHRADLSDPWMAKQVVLSGIYTAVCAFRSW
ncbi:MAG: hypothetical protein GY884_06035, partial [Proteobacteria bacterium]|nr:hypothetical protein [Pseudomonadota bacterium]